MIVEKPVAEFSDFRVPSQRFQPEQQDEDVGLSVGKIVHRPFDHAGLKSRDIDLEDRHVVQTHAGELSRQGPHRNDFVAGVAEAANPGTLRRVETRLRLAIGQGDLVDVHSVGHAIALDVCRERRDIDATGFEGRNRGNRQGRGKERKLAYGSADIRDDPVRPGGSPQKGKFRVHEVAEHQKRTGCLAGKTEFENLTGAKAQFAMTRAARIEIGHPGRSLECRRHADGSVTPHHLGCPIHGLLP